MMFRRQKPRDDDISKDIGCGQISPPSGCLCRARRLISAMSSEGRRKWPNLRIPPSILRKKSYIRGPQMESKNSSANNSGVSSRSANRFCKQVSLPCRYCRPNSIRHTVVCFPTHRRKLSILLGCSGRFPFPPRRRVIF